MRSLIFGLAVVAVAAGGFLASGMLTVGQQDERATFSERFYAVFKS